MKQELKEIETELDDTKKQSNKLIGYGRLIVDKNGYWEFVIINDDNEEECIHKGEGEKWNDYNLSVSLLNLLESKGWNILFLEGVGLVKIFRFIKEC